MLCCAVLCCAILCCTVLCCTILDPTRPEPTTTRLDTGCLLWFRNPLGNDLVGQEADHRCRDRPDQFPSKAPVEAPENVPVGFPYQLPRGLGNARDGGSASGGTRGCGGICGGVRGGGLDPCLDNVEGIPDRPRRRRRKRTRDQGHRHALEERRRPRVFVFVVVFLPNNTPPVQGHELGLAKLVAGKPDPVGDPVPQEGRREPPVPECRFVSEEGPEEVSGAASGSGGIGGCRCRCRLLADLDPFDGRHQKGLEDPTETTPHKHREEIVPLVAPCVCVSAAGLLGIALPQPVSSHQEGVLHRNGTDHRRGSPPQGQHPVAADEARRARPGGEERGVCRSRRRASRDEATTRGLVPRQYRVEGLAGHHPGGTAHPTRYEIDPPIVHAGWYQN
mmetsp:Transcript_33249/g.69542  ORF Transcript_33249/g.69542 Transcript_33249/m.69542 type:complete len:391 (+) Transcript_33249:1643-2815(+)